MGSNSTKTITIDNFFLWKDNRQYFLPRPAQLQAKMGSNNTKTANAGLHSQQKKASAKLLSLKPPTQGGPNPHDKQTR